MRTGSALVLAAVLLACSPTASAEVPLPPDHGSFDYQLGGAYAEPVFDVVARDATATPLAGAYNICYVNGFQTQPGEGAHWLREHPDTILRDAAGAPVVDPDWPDEYVLDPSTATQRATILAELGPLIDSCGQKGFDAIEFDNLDTYLRFPRIDEAGALELARAYVAMAHRAGLAAGQKNAVELPGRTLGFDFAVVEECAAYDECAQYQAAYGRHVLQIEYTDNLPAPFDDVCDSPDRAPLTILRDRDLVPRGTDGYVHRQCPL